MVKGIIECFLCKIKVYRNFIVYYNIYVSQRGASDRITEFSVLSNPASPWLVKTYTPLRSPIGA